MSFQVRSRPFCLENGRDDFLDGRAILTGGRRLFLNALLDGLELGHFQRRILVDGGVK